MEFTKKQRAIYEDLLLDTSGFGNGHSFYLFTGLKRDEVGPALEKIKEVEAENDILFCDMTIDESEVEGENVIYIHCHEKYQSNAIIDMSKAFPYATCYWSDAWDYPDLVEAFINGVEVELPEVCQITIDEDFSDEKNDWYECTATVTDNASGASFYIGGGGISKDCYDNIFSMTTAE